MQLYNMHSGKDTYLMLSISTAGRSKRETERPLTNITKKTLHIKT